MRTGLLSVILFITTSIQLLFGSPVKSQNVDEVNITIGLDNETLVQAFHKIEAHSPFRFMYRKDEVKDVQNIEIKPGTRTVGQFLRNILNGTTLTFKQINNQVLIMSLGDRLISYQANTISTPKIPKYIPKANIVTGHVTNSQGEALAGVSVTIKGTQTGTLTDENGNYSLDIPVDGIIVFSFVGFEAQEMPVNGRNLIDITLVASVSELEQVVIVGYGTQRRGDITGSISTLKGDELNTIPLGDAQKQLQGKVSGVDVTSSGQPGGDSKIRIRGFGSFTSNDPLYVVDGVPTQDISDLDPNSIADVSILKDASAASIYGSRAFAGVILITTKQGRKGDATVNLNLSYGRQFPGSGYDLLGPQQTADMAWIAMENMGQTPSHPQYGDGPTPVLPDYLMAGNNYGLLNSDPNTAALVNPDLINIDPFNGPVYQIVKANKTGTNWYKEVTRRAPIQNHNLSISGGGDNSVYNIQFGYYNQQGIVDYTYLKRYSIRANTEFTIHKRVKIGENLQVALRDNPTLIDGGIGGSDHFALGWAYRENPILPVYDIAGNFAGTAASQTGSGNNPVAEQYRKRNDRTRELGAFGNIYVDVLLPYNLTFHSSFGGTYANSYYNRYGYRMYEGRTNIPSTDFVYEGAGYNFNWVWTNTLTFERHFNKHFVKVLLGEEAIAGQNRNVDVSGHSPFSTSLDYMTINTTQPGSVLATDGGGPFARLFSIFGQVNYSYADKYLFSGTIRRDGSSVFASSSKYGVFPSFSFGWRISREDFMSNISWINDLKIRGSYGEMGNSVPVPLKNQFNTYASSGGNSYDIRGTDNSLSEGIRISGFAAPETKWETNKTLDFGIDMQLLKNKVNLTIDWYKRKTDGLLFAPQVEATVGFLNMYPTINIGSMKNIGVDIQLGIHDNISKDWRYSGGITFSTYKNTILKVSNNSDHFFGATAVINNINLGGNPSINQQGNPMSLFYGYQVEGLWQDQQEIDQADEGARHVTNNPNATFMSGGAKPGEFRFADINGDGIIDPKDRTFIGNPNPDFTYGITLSVGYKAFDLSMDFYGTWGQDILNLTKWYTDFYASFLGGALSKRVLDAWSPTNKNTYIPIFENRSSFSTNAEYNSYYVENGSYFRNRNIQLSYTLPDKFLRNMGIEKLGVFVQATNLFTITNYSGLDPALNGNDNMFGVDLGAYPTVRQFIFGGRFTF